MIMRPDEQANEAEVDRDRKFRSNVKSGISSLGVAGGAVGAGVAGKIMPFLSKYIPTDLAIKGISKISPKIGDFLKRGQSMGLDMEEGLQYVKEQFEPKQEAAKENRNIVEQYSPELHQFILGQIQEGRSPIEAGAIARMGRKGEEHLKKAIDKIEKDHKAPWSSILETVYGGQGSQQPQQPGNQQQDPNAQQQPGQGQAALMAILQKLQQSRGVQ